MLDGIASLLTAVAAVITAVSGLLAVIYLFRRASKKERRQAADSALSGIPAVGDIVKSITEGDPDD